MTKATVGPDKVTLTVEAGGKTETIEVEKVLMAAGRAVNTEDMGFKEAGVKLTDRGFVKVDPATLQTTAPGVYCIGDVAGPPMLAHKGSREGVNVAELIAGQHPHPIRYDNVPSVTYCHPEVASIGLTEDQGKEQEARLPGRPFPVQRQRPGAEHRVRPRASSRSSATRSTARSSGRTSSAATPRR